MKTETGGCAFPRPYSYDDSLDVVHCAQPGMKLRDYIAIKAMQPIMSSLHPDMIFQDDTPDNVSAMSYLFADAMLRARK